MGVEDFMELVLGIDGGGSSTRAVLACADGRVLGRGHGGSSNYNHAGEDGACRAVDAAVDGAWKSAGLFRRPADAVFLGMASVVNAEDRAVIRRIAGVLELAPEGCVGVDHDIRIALTGGLAGRPGVALIAGTGSSCYGRRADGAAKQCGGWGAVADDGGSASWIGREAIRVAVRQADGRMASDGMADLVFRFLGIGSLDDILHRIHVQGVSREEIAALCPGVVAAARDGMPSAARILESAVGELAAMVRGAAEGLGLTEPEVVLAGGLATSGAPFQPLLEMAICETLPSPTLVEALLPPVMGAVLEALAILKTPCTPEIIENLNRPTTS